MMIQPQLDTERSQEIRDHGDPFAIMARVADEYIRREGN
jgi:hypothetical protein